MNNNSTRAALDREFNRPGSSMPLAKYKALLEEIHDQESLPPAPVDEAKTFVTLKTMNGLFMKMATGIGHAMEPIFARLISVERRLSAVEVKATGITIQANGVTVPGMESMAESVDKLNQTLGKPVKPVYDKAGKLIGATREGEAMQESGTIKALEARIKALEARPALEYKGVFQSGIGYERGAVVTKGGCMWHANRATTGEPGHSADWVMAVKHGRDLRR